MPSICPSLLAKGSCSLIDCNLNHLVKFCEHCQQVFASQAEHNTHVLGQKHKKKLAESSINLYCRTCERNIPSHQWSDHVQGGPHASKSTLRGVPVDVMPEAGSPPAGMTHCSLCNINTRSWDQHQSSPKHRKKEQYYIAKAALDAAMSDKKGVSITPQDELNFGVIELHVARGGFEGSLDVQLSDPAARVRIIRARTFSTSKRKNPLFTTTVQNPELSSNSPSPITVRFALQNRGFYEDRIEIWFQEAISLEDFVIARPLLVIVGDPDDQKNLKPVTPYKPKEYGRHAIDKVVPGVAPPANSAIPWVAKLPLALIPKNITERLNIEKGLPGMIKAIRNEFLPRFLDSATHCRHFQLLLWAEERKLAQEIEMYDMSGVTLVAQGHHYILQVPGLAERRPSVLVGDSILAQPCATEAAQGKWFEGFVYTVGQLDVGLRFGASFRHQGPTQRYNIKFRLNRLPLRRQHQALLSDFKEDRVLFPRQAHAKTIRTFEYQGPIYNPLIKSNPPQQSAINLILSQPPGSTPFIIYGPPGTGKTVTVIETMRQLLRDPSVRIFACAPSNAAADVITQRLIDHLTPGELFRFYAPSRLQNQVPPAILAYTHRQDDHFTAHPLEEMNKFRVIVSTCVSASVAYGIGMGRGHFSHIFIDEAAQATEPEVMIPIKTMCGDRTNIILSGDPKQLGPIIRSPIAKELGLELSFLERIMPSQPAEECSHGESLDKENLQDQELPSSEPNGVSVVKLVKNFRSHEAILSVPNEQFYGGQLEVCADPAVINSFIGSRILSNPKFPVVFHAIPGEDLREASSPSFFNIHEVTQVRVYIEELKILGIADEEIGIITPYRAQASKIRQALRNINSVSKVASVEEYQGQERKVIIISTVRSSREYADFDLRHTLGFVADPRRFNVAVTRAKALLIVVGDPSVLCLDPLWRTFMNFVHNSGGWAGDDITQWDPSAPVDWSSLYDEQTRAEAMIDMREAAARVNLTLGDTIPLQEN